MPNSPFSADAVNLLGGTTAAEEMAIENRVIREEGFGSLLERGFNVSNAAKAIWDNAQRTLEYEADSSFDLEANWSELTKGIPSNLHSKFAQANSRAEALAIREGIKRDLESREILAENGASGMAAMLAAGLIDVDILIPSLKSAKLANTVRRGTRMLETAKTAAVAAAVTESALAVTGDTNEWSDVPGAVLASTALGAGLGAIDFSKLSVGMSVREVDDVGSTGAKGAAFDDAPDTFLRAANDFMENANDADFVKALDSLSDVMDAHTGATVFAGDVDTLSARAAAFASTVNVNKKYTTGWLGKFNALLDKSPLADTWGRLFNAPSNTAKALAVSLMENSTGAVVNNRSAAMIKESVFNRSYREFSQGWSELVRNSRKANGIGLLDIKAKAQHEHALSQQVYMAANDLRLGRSVAGYSKEVQEALTHIKKFSEYLRTEAKGGHGGARAVPGFENVKSQSAYIPLHWSGERVRSAVATHGRAKVLAAVRKAYAAANPDMPDDVLDAVTKALIRRAETKGTTIDNNLNSLLAGDGKDFLKQALVDNGVTEDAANNLLERLVSKDRDKGKISYARRRTDIDVASTHDGVRIVDLIDTDLNKVMFQYSDSMSKRIALSRHGIDSAGQVEYIKNRVMAELAEAGSMSPTQLFEYRAFLDHAFAHFEPGSLDRNVNPWVRRAKQATNLSLLGKLGLTQAVEVSATLAQVGVRNFIASNPVLQRVVKEGMNIKQVQDELGWMIGNLGYERGLLRSDLVADMALDLTTQSTDLARRLDDALARGQAVQGALSGYTAVLENQINTAALSVTNKVFRAIKAGKVEPVADMLRSMGVSQKQLSSLKKLVDDGHVKFLESGHVDSLGIDAWSPALREQYGMSLQRAVRQMIQRPLAGESIPWMHETAGSLFTHLQTFPLLAMRKQFVRNIARDDGSFGMLTAYGIGTAAIAGVVGNAMEGREQSVQSITRRTLALSNSIGWTTLGVDPAMALLGLSEYAPGGRFAGEYSLPMLQTLTSATGIPTAVGHAMTGEFSKADKRAMHTIPVVGSMYGMGRVLGALVQEQD